MNERDARAMFSIGQRVKPTVDGADVFRNRLWFLAGKHGTVVGFTRDGRSVRVAIDGQAKASVSAYAPNFWEGA